LKHPLGWQFDHFLGYFAITLLVCFGWPRPFVVGGVLVPAAFLLEGLQAFTPGRTANLVAALCGAGGVLTAGLIAELFVRALSMNSMGYVLTARKVSAMYKRGEVDCDERGTRLLLWNCRY
jgi:VanZ family protein